MSITCCLVVASGTFWSLEVSFALSSPVSSLDAPHAADESRFVSGKSIAEMLIRSVLHLGFVLMFVL